MTPTRRDLLLTAPLALAVGSSAMAKPLDLTGARVRARDLGIAPGLLQPGPLNAITDVPGVRVGQVTLIEGEDIRTGVTAILPHPGNVFQDKVPAAIEVANGFGKLMGSTQVRELGEIETPIVLTNTLSAPQAADGLIDWTIGQPGNEAAVSVNAVVGETNDSRLNAIRRRVVTRDHVLRALKAASGGPVEEGVVGAGTGTVAFGWKGGIGTSSRRIPLAGETYTVGVLVQSNYGGSLQIAGLPIGAHPARVAALKDASPDGSIMIVVATDAPLSDRSLGRLASRAFAGLARTGSAFSNGSGDYCIAFSTAEAVRRTPARRSGVFAAPDVANDLITPLFVAVADATEEAIYNSLLKAHAVESRDGLTGKPVRVEAVDIEALKRLLARRAASGG